MPVTRLLYPLYQLGNPQLRIFRPNWFLTLVRPGKEQPPDTVQFRIPMEMTKCDVKNYLEKIYNVPVGAVRTRIQFGSNKKRNHLNQKVKQPDYKVAYVQLSPEEQAAFEGELSESLTHTYIQAQGQTFTFPNIFPEKDRTPSEGSMEEMQEKFMEDEKQRQKLDPRRGGVTEWFGL
ncbi:39S ribosomal protein L23, mitochondrial isoform X1 [Siniperca chuatsi]|uniref:39S ribosomal protein L23, mitochondrial isoform X1 n=1 Tax=Siniperca chuatsi TaxID=119488 RepID=UPI001CE0F296|nr:39S ribosomal protein L23, mitochondrial isoform X1 [Siniperca chuatsi]